MVGYQVKFHQSQYASRDNAVLNSDKLILNDTDASFAISRCGKEYYCRDAKKGPCHRNEIFAERPSTSGSCFGRYSPSMWRNCRPSTDTEMRKKPSLTGSCELRFPQKPCHGYPSSYRYYRRTSKCYPCSSSPYW